jgi:hypothetical protein
VRRKRDREDGKGGGGEGRSENSRHACRVDKSQSSDRKTIRKSPCWLGKSENVRTNSSPLVVATLLMTAEGTWIKVKEICCPNNSRDPFSVFPIIPVPVQPYSELQICTRTLTTK